MSFTYGQQGLAPVAEMRSSKRQGIAQTWFGVFWLACRWTLPVVGAGSPELAIADYGRLHGIIEWCSADKLITIALR